jgi:hypothetical protein
MTVRERSGWIGAVGSTRRLSVRTDYWDVRSRLLMRAKIAAIEPTVIVADSAFALRYDGIAPKVLTHQRDHRDG